MFHSIKKMAQKSKPSIFVTIGMSILLMANGGLKIVLGFIYRTILNNINIWTTTDIMLLLCATLMMIIICSYGYYLYRMMRIKHVEKTWFNLKNKEIESFLNSYESEDSLGSWLTILQTDLLEISKFFVYTLLPFIVGLILFIIALCFSVSISYKLTLLILLCSSLSILISKVIEKGFVKKIESKLEATDSLNDIVIRFLQYIELIKSYRIVKLIIHKIMGVAHNQQEKQIEMTSREALMMALEYGSGFTLSSVWLVFSAYLVWTNEIGMGEFAYFLGIYDLLNWPFFQGASYWTDVVTARVSFDRATNHYEKYKKIQDYPKLVPLDHQNLYSEFVVDGVAFSYSDKKVLQDFSLKVNNHSHIVIAGESGVGKSTLLKLMTSEIQPSKGNIYVKKDNIIYKTKDIWSYISLMPQRHVVYPCSIAENITFQNKSDIDDERLSEIIKLVKLDQVITERKYGLDMVITEDIKNTFSIGQIQRMMLARALYKKADFLLLDEFSSSVDENTRNEIMEVLNELDNAVITVAHDPDIIKHMSKDGLIYIHKSC